MKIFICNRSIDNEASKKIIADFGIYSENSVVILKETEHIENWQAHVEEKIQDADFVLFLIGSKTFESDHLKWEYGKAKQLNKQIIGIQLGNASKESILFCQGFQVFDNVEQCLKYLKNIFENDRQLKIEQYKIMVSSTEKVTEQRLKVNNLFFTITSSILSVALVLGKAFGFSIAANIGILVLATLSYIVSFFWEKLINSYGNLNTGKFRIIDKIEKQLRTNMFEDEWKVLKDDLKYESNTQTEINIIQNFRILIVITCIAEILYLSYNLIGIYINCE